jgi:hypothetical protein
VNKTTGGASKLVREAEMPNRATKKVVIYSLFFWSCNDEWEIVRSVHSRGELDEPIVVFAGWKTKVVKTVLHLPVPPPRFWSCNDKWSPGGKRVKG